MTRAYARIMMHSRTWIVMLMAEVIKFMCIKFGDYIMYSYEDMNDNIKTQNGAWMTSWLSDYSEKLTLAIRDKARDI